MIAMRRTRPNGLRRCVEQEILDQLRLGTHHSSKSVSAVFLEARHLAAKALSENADNAMVVAALLCKPCHMIASGNFDCLEWTSESLISTGTLDWLEDHFGVEIAESIRLIPHSRRYLASVLPRYFDRLSRDCQQAVLLDGGCMTAVDRQLFSKARYQKNAFLLSRWLDEGIDKWLDLPDIEFFFPFVRVALQADI
jgi:predicted HD phosphohydrolase